MNYFLRILAASGAACAVLGRRWSGKQLRSQHSVSLIQKSTVDTERSAAASFASEPPASQISTGAISPVGRTILPEKDACQSQSNFENLSPVTALLWIEYVDGQGAFSARQISVVRFEPYIDGGLIVDAHCQARNGEMRTFLTTRVKQAVDVETGEAVPDLKQWLERRYKNSPHARATRAIHERFGEIGTLTFIARLAGKMSRTQREIIAAYVAAVSGPAVKVPEDSETLTELIGGVEGTSSQFNAVRRALKKSIQRDQAALIDCAEKIVQSRKAVSGGGRSKTWFKPPSLDGSGYDIESPVT